MTSDRVSECPVVASTEGWHERPTRRVGVQSRSATRVDRATSKCPQSSDLLQPNAGAAEKGLDRKIPDEGSRTAHNNGAADGR